jgi:monoamine oxidase
MTQRRTDSDVLVIGAGAAGLAAAAELAAHGKRVTVLEARDRLGGRILTRHPSTESAPIELGAEFIHGRLEETFAWLARGGIRCEQTEGSQWTLRGGTLVTARGQFDALRAALARLPRPADDISVDAFLDGPARDALPAELREFARGLVEGFDAADPAIASAWELLDEWGVDGLGNAPAFRPVGGYAALVDALARTLDPQRTTLRLDMPVHTIRWRRGDVTAEGAQDGTPCTVAAPQAVVTLPLGVLKLADDAGAVRFEPPLDAKRAALERIAVGPAIKLVLRFRDAFWETLDAGRFRDAAFFHDPDGAFRTFWTTLPERSTWLNAWAGGPKAARLARLDRDGLTHAALDSLKALFGARARPHALLEDARAHDWQTDPYAAGAYSYVAAGGQDARAELAAPLDETLFFAGEATEHEVEAATVDGALRSGRRAARLALGLSPAATEPRRESSLRIDVDDG